MKARLAMPYLLLKPVLPSLKVASTFWSMIRA